MFGLERFFPRTTEEQFPLDATFDRIDYARAQIEALVPEKLLQSFADATYQLKMGKEKGVPRDKDTAFIAVSVLASNLFAVIRFVDSLSRAERDLLNCLPSSRNLDPEMGKAFGRAGISGEKIHQYGALMTVLDEMVVGIEPSHVARKAAALV